MLERRREISLFQGRVVDLSGAARDVSMLKRWLATDALKSLCDGETMAIDEAITLKKLEVFLAFMKHNNMARVSEQLGQSTVSVHRALHSLEDAICCPLFRREGRSLIP